MKRSLVFFVVLLALFSLVHADNDTNATQANTNVTHINETVVSNQSSVSNESSSQQSQVPQITCNANECDKGCVVCQDMNCHDPGFVCTIGLTLDKMAPADTTQGVSEINVLFRNTGTVDLSNISADISGDGVETISAIPIQQLVAGDKDYVFVNTNITKSGQIDLVIKVSSNGVLLNRFVSQVSVAAQAQQQVQTYNATQLNLNLTQLNTQYNSLTQQYDDKKNNGYTVSDFVANDLQEVSTYLANAQTSLINGDYQSAVATMAVIQTRLSDISDSLMSSQKPQTSLGSAIKNNLLFVASIAAALISIFTAYTLIKNSINRENIAKLHQKITFLHKEEKDEHKAGKKHSAHKKKK